MSRHTPIYDSYDRGHRAGAWRHAAYLLEYRVNWPMLLIVVVVGLLVVIAVSLAVIAVKL